MAQASEQALREAVEGAVHQAELDHHGRQDMIVGEFVVIASAHGFDEEGESITQVVILPRDGSEHRILGLVDHAMIRMKADILDGYDQA